MSKTLITELEQVKTIQSDTAKILNELEEKLCPILSRDIPSIRNMKSVAADSSELAKYSQLTEVAEEIVSSESEILAGIQNILQRVNL